jgi:small GTP-binding protein
VIIKKKIIMLGDSAVGKTSMVRRFVFDQFEDTYISTIGSKVSKKGLQIKRGGDEVELKLVIWDILGRVGYNATHARSFAGADGAILIADLSRKETLKSLERYWIPLLFEVVENVPMVFASNKSDLVGDISYKPEEMEEIASRYNLGIKDSLHENLQVSYMTSAKTGENVENVFESLGHLLLSDKIPEDPIKELYESLVAEGIYRQTDKKTLIGATDAIIVNFCEGLEDEKMAMIILRQEITRAGLDIANPKKKALLRVVEYLAEAENDYLDEETLLKNKKRRMSLVMDVRG